MSSSKGNRQSGVAWAESTSKPKLVSYGGSMHLPRFTEEAPTLSNTPALATMVSPREKEAPKNEQVEAAQADEGKPKFRPLSVGQLDPRALAKRLFNRKEEGMPVPRVRGGLAPNRMIDGSLEELLEQEQRTVPVILEECASWLRLNAIDRPGLFRVPPDLSKIDQLVQRFEFGTFSAFDTVSSTSEEVSSLFKLFLRRLPDSLTTRECYTNFVDSVDTEYDEREQVAALREAVECVREPEQTVLRFVMGFLREVSVHSATNKLGVRALTSMFGPVLLRAPSKAEAAAAEVGEVMRMLISNYAAIFLGEEVPASAEAREPREARRRRRKKKKKKAKPVAESRTEETTTDDEEDAAESDSEESEEQGQFFEPAARLTIRLPLDSKLKPEREGPLSPNAALPSSSQATARTSVFNVFQATSDEDVDEAEAAERAKRLEQVRIMIENDPRFESAPSVPTTSRRKKKKKRRPPAASGATTSRRRRKKRRPKKCPYCGELVRGEKVTAMGKVFHQACFVCSTCEEPLREFFECEGLPYCAQHIDDAEEAAWGLFDDEGHALCGRCEERLVEGNVVNALGKKWHLEHFTCWECDCRLDSYVGAGGLPYCEEHIAQGQALVAATAPAPRSKPKPRRKPKPKTEKPPEPAPNKKREVVDFSKFPKKQGPMMWYNKAKKRADKVYVVLEKQLCVVHKDEPGRGKGGPPLAMLDLQMLRKIRQLESHQNRAHAIAVSIEYDTTIFWAEDALDADDWVEAMVHSNPDQEVLSI